MTPKEKAFENGLKSIAVSMYKNGILPFEKDQELLKEQFSKRKITGLGLDDLKKFQENKAKCFDYYLEYQASFYQ